MAAKLSDTTVDGLAEFFSSQTPAAGSTGGDRAEIVVGQKIFEEGIPAKNVPPCKACHGEKAEGQVAFPRLAGQHRSYLEDQLNAFATESRANARELEESDRCRDQSGLRVPRCAVDASGVPPVARIRAAQEVASI
ncbi:MAG TPA: c-type cytochrome [Stellaceae bacterium]|nr:c-type cytochrome [Stellaceae bacterium]